MPVIRKNNEREVLFNETVIIRDHEGDEIVISVTYNSTTEPEGAALMEIDITESGQEGSWVTAADFRAMAQLFLDAAAALELAGKPAPKPVRFRRK